ncbi:alpha-hydroxy-acid oxidizing protein [Acinetobacter bereziniae]|uniref:alpha-hydroxy acid oxidase n=1 Tax=Acinetobacter TaxID=469 RepID=UPI000EF70F9E|nr:MULTISPECIES: alpha-hydroxy acid oxidase [Acinetobacter]MBJ8423002.1 alpha-hydroxy-acid oxidizing protein [Acinetobacter bereziniae]MBJ9948997.1 alpha-hydroxy-acid oxidizing protein [Acinetobacter bereziniae]MCU4475697.1 alpha-hydroxy-acid oxidizing protein [Acinetobacter bereziniae]MCU4541196.1 alpha-hydroxy-acid oxidizing protein [Acinetobacter bereziniae]MCU4627494.1 alpha-hydroxy-acid oxidizing protein [Acinetobacter bereziniae]
MTTLQKITCVADMREIYHRRVPKMFVDYCDSGSWTEQTWQQNSEDFKKYLFRQKVLVDMNNRSVKTEMLGQSVSMPVALAPTGLIGMQHADGEILAAKAAEKFGIPYIMSTMSICSIEDVAAATTQPFWFQLYMMKDRHFMQQLIQRAKNAKCSALVLTADLQIMGQRHKDIKNGLSAPPKLTLGNLINMCTKPVWCLAMLKTPRRSFGNIVGHVDGISNTGSLAAWTTEQFDMKLSWRDVEWVKQQWGGKLIIKGIMEVDDAIAAVNAGADAIVVSNHGGRQLDSAPSSISVLEEIVLAVGDKTEVYIDSGIRSGQDVLKAIALGAKGCLIGRAFIYGLGAYGEQGVYRVLEIIQKELDLSMAFCGKVNIQDIDKSILR